MALFHVNFFSDELGMDTSMDVIIPQKKRCPEQYDTGKKIPVLTLLHGASDDHTVWQRKTSIERYVNDLGLAVVMPCTNLGWYADMYYGQKYFSFIADELPKICRYFFPNLSDRREDNFVAGLSMGGYGAMKLALSRPQRFAAAAQLSGAVDIVSIMKKRVEGGTVATLFGSIERLEGGESDLFALAERAAAEKTELPDIFMWCGTEDFLYEDNIKFREHLTKLGIKHVYSEGPGEHTWDKWDEQIQNVIAWLPLNN